MNKEKKSGGKRKKSVIIIPVIIAIVVIAMILLQLPQLLFAFVTMKPLDTGEVRQNIYAVRDSYVNVYLYKSGDKYIAFDAGANAKAVSDALDSLGIDKEDVTAVFLTHTDGDHVMALTIFPGAEVIMSESNRIFIETQEGQARSKAFVDMDREYSTLNNGMAYTTAAGIEIKCIYTPGHTPGSVSYIVDGKYLFTGDNLRLKDGRAELFYDVFNMDNETQQKSLALLSGIDDNIEAIFTMHNGYTTDSRTAFEKWQ